MALTSPPPAALCRDFTSAHQDFAREVGETLPLVLLGADVTSVGERVVPRTHYERVFQTGMGHVGVVSYGTDNSPTPVGWNVCRSWTRDKATRMRGAKGAAPFIAGPLRAFFSVRSVADAGRAADERNPNGVFFSSELYDYDACKLLGAWVGWNMQAVSQCALVMVQKVRCATAVPRADVRMFAIRDIQTTLAVEQETVGRVQVRTVAVATEAEAGALRVRSSSLPVLARENSALLLTNAALKAENERLAKVVPAALQALKPAQRLVATGKLKNHSQRMDRAASVVAVMESVSSGDIRAGLQDLFEFLFQDERHSDEAMQSWVAYIQSAPASVKDLVVDTFRGDGLLDADLALIIKFAARVSFTTLGVILKTLKDHGFNVMTMDTREHRMSLDIPDLFETPDGFFVNAAAYLKRWLAVPDYTRDDEFGMVECDISKVLQFNPHAREVLGDAGKTATTCWVLMLRGTVDGTRSNSWKKLEAFTLSVLNRWRYTDSPNGQMTLALLEADESRETFDRNWKHAPGIPDEGQFAAILQRLLREAFVHPRDGRIMVPVFFNVSDLAATYLLLGYSCAGTAEFGNLFSTGMLLAKRNALVPHKREDIDFFDRSTGSQCALGAKRLAETANDADIKAKVCAARTRADVGAAKDKTGMKTQALKNARKLSSIAMEHAVAKAAEVARAAKANKSTTFAPFFEQLPLACNVIDAFHPSLDFAKPLFAQMWRHFGATQAGRLLFFECLSVFGLARLVRGLKKHEGDESKVKMPGNESSKFLHSVPLILQRMARAAGTVSATSDEEACTTEIAAVVAQIGDVEVAVRAVRALRDGPQAVGATEDPESDRDHALLSAQLDSLDARLTTLNHEHADILVRCANLTSSSALELDGLSLKYLRWCRAIDAVLKGLQRKRPTSQQLDDMVTDAEELNQAVRSACPKPSASTYLELVRYQVPIMARTIWECFGLGPGFFSTCAHEHRNKMYKRTLLAEVYSGRKYQETMTLELTEILFYPCSRPMRHTQTCSVCAVKAPEVAKGHNCNASRCPEAAAYQEMVIAETAGGKRKAPRPVRDGVVRNGQKVCWGLDITHEPSSD